MILTQSIKIYDNIYRIAHKKDISINSIEKGANLGIGSLSKWNVVSPSVRSLKKVADYLGVSIETLLEDNSISDST